MKLLPLTRCLFVWYTTMSNAQPTNGYFQQKVDYVIKATLHDTTHTLDAEIQFTYQNNSPNALQEIWVHLWGNAYQNRKTAFCKQQLKSGDREYYFSKPEDRGGFSGLDFRVDGQQASWKIDPNNPDIAVVTLSRPLATGQKITVSTPFTLKIPASFSRLGHVETSYQMPQWYPKPAVYDHKGWHAMPYLNMGEFYSEFGSFDVTLTLPDNYVVGATGLLQTGSEILFLQKKEAETRELLSQKEPHKTAKYPASSSRMKTIRYTADLVHDFAWFADKRFMVLKDTARLASGKSVDCWAMFRMSKESKMGRGQSKYWEKGAFYVRRAVEFYSEHVGEYPYPQATAVHSALSAGGGMEYPMITVIGNSDSAQDLDDVITHEVGHNWFYGFLASNERDHPFMDEGFNTYYESRYMKKYYGKFGPANLPKVLLDESKQGSLMETGYLLLAREHKDTPPDSHSDSFTSLAYGLEVYMKTALVLDWLEKSVGTEKFDAAMKDYYRNWQFSHPYPEDLKASFKQNGINADWFFQSMQTRDQLDLKISSVKPAKARTDGNFGLGAKQVNGYHLFIKNKGSLDAPFPVTALQEGKPVSTRWFTQGDIERSSGVFFQTDSADAFEIDYERVTLDINRKNNFRKTGGLFPGMRPLEYRLFAPVQNTRKNTLAIIPWIGWNNADKTMLGLMIYNPPVPSRKFQYYLLPGYGLGTGQWVGAGNLRYQFFPGGIFPKVAVSLRYKSFHTGQRQDGDITDRFTRWMPQVRAQLRSSRPAFEHALVFRTLLLERDYQRIASEQNATQKNTIYELRYEGEQWKAPHPFKYQVALEAQDYTDQFERNDQYIRLAAEWQQKFFYQEKRKITLRVFAGAFLQNSRSDFYPNEYSLTLAPQGINDYRFDQLYLARTGANHLLGRQVSQSDGGFKGPISSILPGQTGLSNQYLVTMNLMADLPFKLPLRLPVKPYFDLGYFKDGSPDADQNQPFVWSGGLALSFFKGGLEFYFPIYSSKTLQDAYQEASGANYAKMISWSMRLNFQEPMKLIEKISR
ncbi:MAG TPA: hypothetical protein DCF33_18195 [Saprospirales bacterium]|nr:hypothetical protein [Saprospirales bacterium]